MAGYTGTLVGIPAAGDFEEGQHGGTVWDLYAPDVTTPPAVSSIVPASGSVIAKSQVISLEIADSQTLRRVVIYAKYGLSPAWEVVHDGSVFSATFTGAANNRTSITDGYHYDLLRDGGWHTQVTLVVVAVNCVGTQFTTTLTWPLLT